MAFKLYEQPALRANKGAGSAAVPESVSLAAPCWPDPSNDAVCIHECVSAHTCSLRQPRPAHSLLLSAACLGERPHLPASLRVHRHGSHPRLTLLRPPSPHLRSGRARPHQSCPRPRKAQGCLSRPRARPAARSAARMERAGGVALWRGSMGRLPRARRREWWRRAALWQGGTRQLGRLLLRPWLRPP